MLWIAWRVLVDSADSGVDLMRAESMFLETYSGKVMWVVQGDCTQEEVQNLYSVHSTVHERYIDKEGH